MANLKISALTAISTFASGDLFAVVDTDVTTTKKATLTQLAAAVQSEAGLIDGTLTSPLVPYATAAGTLGNSGLTWDNVNSRLGVNETTPLAKTHFTGGTLPTGVPLVYGDGTFTAAVADQNLVRYNPTGAGSASGKQRGIFVDFKSGYTGPKLAVGIATFMNSASTGTTVMGSADDPNCTMGVFSFSTPSGTTAGHSVGGWHKARYSTSRALGLVGIGQSDSSASCEAIGVYGTAYDIGHNIGGMFTLYGQTDTINVGTTDVALVADNASTTGKIFSGRDNGTAVLEILDGGNVEYSGVLKHTSASGSAAHFLDTTTAHAGGDYLFTVADTGTWKFRVNQQGTMYSYYAVITYSMSARNATFGATATTQVPLIVTRSSGTVDLQQWKDSGSNVVASVSDVGELLAKRKVTAVTTTTAPDVNSDNGMVYSNEGATAQVTVNLPTAAAGLTYTFVVQDTDGYQINAATGDTIRIAGSVSASAGNIVSTTVGDTVTLVAINATEWVAIAYIGSWTVT